MQSLTKRIKMKTVQIGDLVKLFRRKRPGLGLVTVEIKDIVKEMKNPEALCSLYKTRESGHTFQQRNAGCATFIEECGLPTEIAEAFLRYNSFHSYRPLKPLTKGGPKVSFVYVRWFKAPSEYEQIAIKHNSGWYPAGWLKKLE
jgi:hypothetical protein